MVTPSKDHLPPSSGSTPLGESSFKHRIHLRMLGGPDFNTQPGGVKGWREESPVKLYPADSGARVRRSRARASPSSALALYCESAVKVCKG